MSKSKLLRQVCFWCFAEEIIPSQNEKSGLRRDVLVHLAVHGVGFMVVQVCNCLFILYRVLAINPHLDGLRLTCLLVSHVNRVDNTTCNLSTLPALWVPANAKEIVYLW